MFVASPWLRRAYRPQRWHRLHRLGDFRGALGSLRRYSGAAPRLFPRQRRRQPWAGLILVAGIAAVTYAWLLTASNRLSRSRAEKAIFGIGLAAVGLLLLSLRRYSARYRW
jgi:hypothetical protein